MIGVFRSLGVALSLAAQVAGSRACPAGARTSFAWWVGTWDYAIPKYDPAVSTIVATDDGCTLDESFLDRTGGKMHTTLRFDESANAWQRTVTDPSRTYTSTGKFDVRPSAAIDNAVIVFYETPTEREGYRRTDRDHVHFIGESSKDGGKTWSVQFDALYTRHN